MLSIKPKTKKFVYFWLPYEVKYTYETFLTAYYIAVNRFPAADCFHIGPKELLWGAHDKPAHWLSAYDCYVPTAEQLQVLPQTHISSEIFHELQELYISNNLVWQHLLTKRYLPLENELERIFANLIEQYEIEAVIAWCNTPSLLFVAQKMGIKVIHNEMGPLRAPDYVHTCYFDFSGVNGNTSSEQRFQTFLSEQTPMSSQVLSLAGLRTLLGEDCAQERLHARATNEFTYGVPLQVEDDSNVLAFANGLNNIELIQIAKHNSESLSIRKHPAGHLDYPETNDDSSDVIAFIKRCESILTVNSSVAFEAMLHGKRSYILGDSPFKFLANKLGYDEKPEKLLLKINFIIFGYLIPFDLLYNVDYYRWRLTEPTEIEIYNYHLRYYCDKKRIPIDQQNTTEEIENFMLQHLIEENYQRTREAETKHQEACARILKIEKQVSDHTSTTNQLNNQLSLNEILFQEKLSEFDNCKRELIDSQTQIQVLQKELHDLNQNCHHWYISSQGFEQRLNEFYASRSWRVTKPLRFLKRLATAPRESLKLVIKKSGQTALKYPLTKKLGKSVFHKLPVPLQGRLFRLITAEAAPVSAIPLGLNEVIVQSDLSPQAQSVYSQLKNVIDRVK